MRFADLHLHNHTASLLWLRPNATKHQRKGEYHPWTVISDNRKALEKGRMGSAYSQADLVKAWNGKLRLSFNSLYPIEKGFFTTSMKGISGENRLLKAFTRVLSSQGLPLRDALHMIVQHVPDATVDHIQSPAYDYWSFLNEEYDFVRSRDGQVTRNGIHTPFLWRQILESERKRRIKYSEELEATGTYTIPKDKAHLAQCLGQDGITMVLTIEGAHAFGVDISLAERMARIDHIRKNWAHPVFFVTFAHHFDNGLCGHANSFPRIATYVMDQTAGKNEGFNAMGRAVLRHLLALDDGLVHDPAIGYRMLIDVKHMSAKARKEFYDEVVEPCRALGDTIPVIASHCGYTGVDTLQQLIDAQDKEKDDVFAPGHFNNWNINVCREDLRMIVRTGGLFGLSMDQRILGVHSDEKNAGGRNTIVAVWANVRAVVHAVYTDPDIPEMDKPKIWQCLSLGSDFGGWIDPINNYATLLQYGQLRSDLIAAMERERPLANATPALAQFDTLAKITAVVDAMCYGNAEAFVRRNYPTT